MKEISVVGKKVIDFFQEMDDRIEDGKGVAEFMANMATCFGLFVAHHFQQEDFRGIALTTATAIEKVANTVEDNELRPTLELVENEK